MNKLYFHETKGVLIDKCKFTDNAMVGSLNCQQCKHCLAMSTTQNWVICELNKTENENENDNEKTN